VRDKSGRIVRDKFGNELDENGFLKCKTGTKKKPASVAAPSYDDLVKAAQAEFPGKAGKIEEHHITPKYLGGDPDGPTIPLDAAYHQKITSEFRKQWGYGQGPPNSAELQRIMEDVYKKYPLPPGN
jgi:hypothetical protein